MMTIWIVGSKGGEMFKEENGNETNKHIKGKRSRHGLGMICTLKERDHVWQFEIDLVSLSL